MVNVLEILTLNWIFYKDGVGTFIVALLCIVGHVGTRLKHFTLDARLVLVASTWTCLFNNDVIDWTFCFQIKLRFWKK